VSAVIHRAGTRGFFDHGWLRTFHTFSFGDYRDPERMGFGLLRVLNDDTVQPASGFGAHSHQDMEIVSIPLQGALKHEDSEGNRHVISAGDIQIMSAGRGIRHSERNHSDSEPVNFLQIWVLPEKRGIAPRYGQRTYDAAGRRNRFQTVVSPEGAAEDAIRINQQAWFDLADIDPGNRLEYEAHRDGNAVYLFVVEGRVSIAGSDLNRRDGIGIADPGPVPIRAYEAAAIVAIDVPMAPGDGASRLR
jgi:redox-sensitive bicupin YhaK (pirin superfamily)